MALPDLLADLHADPQFMANVTAWRTLAERPARLEPLPAALHPNLAAVLQERGIEQLYCHQAQAVALALGGQNVVVVTPTASGKTLCYNLPVLHTLLTAPDARALYLFPTKALANDQLAELHTWQSQLTQGPRDQETKRPRDQETKRPRDQETKRPRDQETKRPRDHTTTRPRDQATNLLISTYDGDTPANARTRIRNQARLILTNPDMLHAGILPYHTAWEPLLSNLRYVIIDELHSYRGVFGSHVANVLRRLQRLCARYGARPQFICTSATIANPQQLAEQLVEQPVTLVAENGAPNGEKQIILYNPPLYDAEKGLRRSAILEAQELTTRCLLGGLQTILFGRSRLTTELLLTYLRDRLARLPPSLQPLAPSLQSPVSGLQSPVSGLQSLVSSPQSPISSLQSSIRGYRGGYLPNERREIETGLRSGAVRGVVATNALELGIDIGGLQAAVLCGYPGSIASAWQQMGRAGRTREGALAILVATGNPLDQYIIQHPEFLFERSPEHALINPNNLMLLVDQVRCAAFELPFQLGETFGGCTFTEDVLRLLVEQGTIQHHGGRFFWSGEGYPARHVSLRNAGGDAVLIQAENQPQMNTNEYRLNSQSRVEVIGEIDPASAPLLLHEGAIYLHEGQSYRVHKLDLHSRLAQVTLTEVDYYTEAATETKVELLTQHEERSLPSALVSLGDLAVHSQVVSFRRVKRFTHETLGVQPLDYPPQTLETSGYWFSILPATQALLEQQGQWFDSVNNYGPNWQTQRTRVRARDGYRCTQCGAPEAAECEHDVHHLTPFRTFGYVPGLNEYYLEANQLSNLTLLCRSCHRRLEAGVRVRSGLDGLAYALTNIAPLHLMCAPQDIGVHIERGASIGSTNLQSPISSLQPPAHLPTLYFYERITAGLGFSARLFEIHEDLLLAARTLIQNCRCQQGCPACVGPVLDNPQAQLPTKALTLALLDALIVGPLQTALPIDVEWFN